MIFITIETILTGNYDFLSYQNVCMYKMAWHSVSRALNHNIIVKSMVYNDCIEQ